MFVTSLHYRKKKKTLLIQLTKMETNIMVTFDESIGAFFISNGLPVRSKRQTISSFVKLSN
jgi:hypothetical protein